MGKKLVVARPGKSLISQIFFSTSEVPPTYVLHPQRSKLMRNIASHVLSSFEIPVDHQDIIQGCLLYVASNDLILPTLHRLTEFPSKFARSDRQGSRRVTKQVKNNHTTTRRVQIQTPLRVSDDIDWERDRSGRITRRPPSVRSIRTCLSNYTWVALNRPRCIRIRAGASGTIPE